MNPFADFPTTWTVIATKPLPLPVMCKWAPVENPWMTPKAAVAADYAGRIWVMHRRLADRIELVIKARGRRG